MWKVPWAECAKACNLNIKGLAYPSSFFWCMGATRQKTEASQLALKVLQETQLPGVVVVCSGGFAGCPPHKTRRMP